MTLLKIQENRRNEYKFHSYTRRDNSMSLYDGKGMYIFLETLCGNELLNILLQNRKHNQSSKGFFLNIIGIRKFELYDHFSQISKGSN